MQRRFLATILGMLLVLELVLTGCSASRSATRAVTPQGNGGSASCAWSLDDPTGALAWADVVFVGTVASVGNAGTTATVNVDDVWKGDNVPAVAEVDGSMGAETQVFAVGQKYLFVPDKTPRPYHAYTCGVRPYDPSLDAHRPADAHPPIEG
jgi:hypothetical protein